MQFNCKLDVLLLEMLAEKNRRCKWSVFVHDVACITTTSGYSRGPWNVGKMMIMRSLQIACGVGLKLNEALTGFPFLNIRLLMDSEPDVIDGTCLVKFLGDVYVTEDSYVSYHHVLKNKMF